MLQNYKLVLEYNGANFSGSQRQENERTVQGELELGLSKFFNTEIQTTFSSRTDAGVHAIGQVVNFKLAKVLDEIESNPDKLLISLNSQLPNDMVLTKIESVAEDFHARFHARAREYLYKIFVRRHRPVLRMDTLSWEKEPLDFDLMQKHAKTYLGTHDFTKFAKLDEHDEAECTVEKSELIKESDICYKYQIKSNRFLRHMVRRIVGELILVGKGYLLEELPSISAPASGLTLIKVYYS